ncbi:2-keto-4-pentenoate hydratase/2-oxohepta-3-ene-1,7-dioic acid hydratase in catechol pathway [Branchiibius hedensis]|uniref:2-keto-4-pentenoate hydratase/2-oxohepta-3-ene-1,7-dioic acid hydratase (Catechol pathway) n=1 Tax=Branchiibius hedensis TaxID=672460 RepID=A0A2Y8ZVC6_9MICO|nr:fumarylacetoacetate hydrolase family protein [Branchiibius hedensis]PWJ25022.1 2-keto-4-pentenoate hydratase/2-oxohepta-3-ene-1,7-dioic acid hydratase in catechol pathway [Branchiibius hedensis]SSA33837.1 2-keto-4-pentenoate hydratase/2-oxohepta-3-ene-1,7-dioic acid hydratase (catechol pathway) [Branchiibius hedensis]
MKIVRFRRGDDVGVAVRDGSGGIHPTGYRDLRELLAAADPLGILRRSLEGPAVMADRLLAPLADRCQIVSTGGNYQSHLAEVGLAPQEPVFFPKLWSAVLDPDSVLEPPRPESELDYEVELAVVIGRTMHRVSAAEALDYVFGYTVVNDVSAREVMRREPLQIMLCKSADGFLPVSEEIVTADEIDLDTTVVTCDVNGQRRQEAGVAEMITSVPRLLAFLSQYVTLTPGDVVTTGTPGGSLVGRPGLGYLTPGDVVTVAATGIRPATTTIGSGLWQVSA